MPVKGIGDFQKLSFDEEEALLEDLENDLFRAKRQVDIVRELMHLRLENAQLKLDLETYKMWQDRNYENTRETTGLILQAALKGAFNSKDTGEKDG